MCRDCLPALSIFLILCSFSYFVKVRSESGAARMVVTFAMPVEIPSTTVDSYFVRSFGHKFDSLMVSIPDSICRRLNLISYVATDEIRTSTHIKLRKYFFNTITSIIESHFKSTGTQKSDPYDSELILNYYMCPFSIENAAEERNKNFHFVILFNLVLTYLLLITFRRALNLRKDIY